MKQVIACLAALVAVAAGPAVAAPNNVDAEHRRVVEHWTPARRAAAIPRDLVRDARGLGYLRRVDGSLMAYGRAGGDQLTSKNPVPVPQGKPGGGGSDSTPPTISNRSPANGATIGSSSVFSAQVTDASSVGTVTFVLTYPNGTQTQNFTPAFIGNNTWQTTIQGFSNGQWSWKVVAKDKAKPANTTTSTSFAFTVNTGGGGGGGGGSYIVTNDGWTGGGVVQNAAGRIYFEMPGNSRRTNWGGYVCSGTVATDQTSGRSVIITAAHCVYDDHYKAFARNVLFIPNQDGTSGAGTDTNCSNDPLGCWTPAFGAVDTNWTTRVFPDNVAWDYAYYVVNDTGAHSGTAASSNVLDAAAGSMAISFSPPYTNDGNPSASSIDFTHALGYSYSEDPNFMYCAEDMTAESSVNWWLASCGLSGGASGGPWVQPLSGGNGPLISVNSWGYTGQPGMAGPKLSGTSASCIFTQVKTQAFSSVPTTDGDEGVKYGNCP
jgi:hypothetical protein